MASTSENYSSLVPVNSSASTRLINSTQSDNGVAVSSICNLTPINIIVFIVVLVLIGLVIGLIWGYFSISDAKSQTSNFASLSNSTSSQLAQYTAELDKITPVILTVGPAIEEVIPTLQTVGTEIEQKLPQLDALIATLEDDFNMSLDALNQLAMDACDYFLLIERPVPPGCSVFPPPPSPPTTSPTDQTTLMGQPTLPNQVGTTPSLAQQADQVTLARAQNQAVQASLGQINQGNFNCGINNEAFVCGRSCQKRRSHSKRH